jgi:hypothetical protein
MKRFGCDISWADVCSSKPKVLEPRLNDGSYYMDAGKHLLRKVENVIRFPNKLPQSFLGVFNSAIKALKSRNNLLCQLLLPPQKPLFLLVFLSLLYCF